MRILAEDTLVLVIDYQEKLIPAMDGKEEAISASVILLKGLKELGIPMIVTQQYTKGLGGTIGEISEAIGEFTAFDKKAFSAYEDEAVKEAIDSTGKKNIIVCGTEAHVCVLQSVIDLRAAGYNTILITDCIASRSKYDKKLGIKRAQCEGSYVSSYEAILFELCGGAYNEHFKAISQLVK